MFLEDYNCAVCALCTEETLLHLFLDCPFAMDCWGTLGLSIQHSDDPFQTTTSFRSQLAILFSMEIIILMCWPFGQSEMMQYSEMCSRLLLKPDDTSGLILLKLSLEQKSHTNLLLVNG